MDKSLRSSFADGVDGTELMAHMREVARWTKLAGTETELKSLEYFKRKLEEYGFRTELILHDAYISLPGASRVSVGGRDFTSITHSFSQPSPTGGLEGELVHVGKGTEADFAKVDTTGRIVLVEAIATPEISRRATRAGAAGQLHISPHEQRYEMCISPVWGSPTKAQLALLPKTVVTTISQPDGQAILARLKAGETLRAVLHAEVDTGWRKTPILVADMAGPDASEDAPFVMLSCHHDTWYYGVMDNGGANATALEIARLAAARRADWARGLRLCFWSGHSQGRYSGSAWYADEHWDELERRCAAHVNIDSTGGMDATELHETAAMTSLKALASEAVEQHAGQHYAGKRRGRSGDDSFGGIGIPSMFGPVSEQDPSKSNGRKNLGWWWHTPEDLLDKIDETNLVRDTRVVGHALWRLLSDARLPIDLAAQIEDLGRQIDRLEGEIGDRLPLAPLREGAADLREAIRRLAGAADTARVNHAVMRACRALVPVDYTSGDRFRHEPAVPVPAWPSLQPLRDFASAPAGSEDAAFLKVDAVRARNRVAHALREANAALAAAV